MNTEKLVDWLINHIKTNYKDDIALVIHCNSLKAPGEENSPFPEFFIPITEKGKELACSFIIGGKNMIFITELGIISKDLKMYQIIIQ